MVEMESYFQLLSLPEHKVHLVSTVLRLEGPGSKLMLALNTHTNPKNKTPHSLMFGCLMYRLVKKDWRLGSRREKFAETGRKGANIVETKGD